MTKGFANNQTQTNQNDQEHLLCLNAMQKEAVMHTEGPVLIIAGAGAGKTKTITHRIAHLMKTGVEPHEILAVTFTNKAAKEMRERVIDLIDRDRYFNYPVNALLGGMSLPFISTFHGLGASILREDYKMANIPSNFMIFDRSDSIRAIKKAMKKLGYDSKQYEPKIILNIISKSKGENLTREDFAQSAKMRSSYGKIAFDIWREYEKVLKKEKGIDFDDLLLKAYLLLKNNANIRKKYQNRWKYIHIDEYQDTNTVQYDLIKLLVGYKQNICVVGDGDQCIYTWRQAKPENIEAFKREFDNVKTVFLEQNYRSSGNILAAANEIISKNRNRIEKTLFTKNDAGDKIKVYNAFNEKDEAMFAAQECERLIYERNVSPENIAVLYRANFQSRILEEYFLRANVPYQVLGVKFFDRKEIKDVFAYLRASLNPDSITDLARAVATPPRGIGQVTLSKMVDGREHELTKSSAEKVRQFRKLLSEIKDCAFTKKVSETMIFIIKNSGMEAKYKNGTDEEKEKLENLGELVNLASKYDNMSPQDGIMRLLEDVALSTDQDELDNGGKAVKLMTVHASKGLEFDYVFVTGLEEGLFPHEKDDEDVDDEEERRLFYVAITRAGKRLYLSYANSRSIYGRTQYNVPSVFLNDLNPEYIEYVSNNTGKHLAHSSQNHGEQKIDLIDF